MFQIQYIIDFPEAPANTNETIDSERGKLTLDIQTYEPDDKSENMIFIAMETRYAKSLADQNDIYALNKFYKSSVDGALASVNGELITINDIYYKKYLGKEFRCYINEGKAIIVYRALAIDDRMYMTGVITYPDKEKNKEMIKFLDSFKLNE